MANLSHIIEPKDLQKKPNLKDFSLTKEKKDCKLVFRVSYVSSQI